MSSALAKNNGVMIADESSRLMFGAGRYVFKKRQ